MPRIEVGDASTTEKGRSLFDTTKYDNKSYSECVLGATSNFFTVLTTLISIPICVKRKSYFPLLLLTLVGSSADIFCGFVSCRRLKPGAEHLGNVREGAMLLPKMDHPRSPRYRDTSSTERSPPS